MRKLSVIVADVRRRIVQAYTDYKKRELWRVLCEKERDWLMISGRTSQIPIGRCDYVEALARATKHGPVGYVDLEGGIIFTNLPGHSGERPPGAPGIS